MEILVFNIGWMSWNIFLAFLGVIFGGLFLRSTGLIPQAIFLVLWVLFVPNTIYMVTDLQYFPEQLTELGFPLLIILLIQYIVVFSLGVITYFLGMLPLGKIVKDNKAKKQAITYGVFFLANYLIAFGVALGKFERINSWDVFTKPVEVTRSSLYLLSSFEMVILILIFGTLINALYFSFKR